MLEKEITEIENRVKNIRKKMSQNSRKNNRLYNQDKPFDMGLLKENDVLADELRILLIKQEKLTGTKLVMI